jgi:hypothetical protein
MPKIMLFAHDPGGGNAISPLIKAFEKRRCEVFSYVSGPAAKIISSAKGLRKEDIDIVLDDLKPDFIITGTSSNDFTEKFLWKAAKKIGVPTMAVLDHWCNYGIRFSKYGLKDIHKYNSDKTFDFLPSYICVMDDFARNEMHKEGIPLDMIFALGNPHFKTIKTSFQNVDIHKVRSKFVKNNDKKIITFASEPYEEDYGIAPERKALDDIKEVLSRRDDVVLVVKLHPKESENKYKKFAGCCFDKETASVDLIAISDIIISMTSMFLIEACILGKKSLSYQPNENDRTKFVLTRNHVLPFINNPKELNNELTNLLNIKEMNYNFIVDFNATDNIVKFVEKRFCRN